MQTAESLLVASHIVVMSRHVNKTREKDNQKNTFDVDSYLSSLRRKKRRVITEDEPFDLYDIELSDEDFAAE